ncbi:MAG: acetolactate synthase-1/2/3 large subunit [Gammaproteobacteria bacterium]|jgi:acetolactate synthase-1/2/3 large subunit
MSEAQQMRSGGQILVDALRIHDVDTVFCVPGESYLAVIDALRDANSIRTIVCRQEGGAAFMAEAYGKLTGKPGILMVTRGPGACNASIGVHTAHQDSTPMVVLIGQVGRDMEYREGFQEMDYHTFYQPLTKWVAQADDPARIPELMSQAFYRAMSGRAGPVALSLPEDALREPVHTEDTQRYKVVQAAPGAADMSVLHTMLSAASKPLVIVGGYGWTQEACEQMQAFAEKTNVPVLASFRCQDRFDNLHPNYGGELGTSVAPKLAQRVKEADLIIAIGARLGEMTTGEYSLITPPCPVQTLIHVYPDPTELGRVYQPELAICSGVSEFAAAAQTLPTLDHGAWDEWTASTRADYEEQFTQAPPPSGDLDMAKVMEHLNACLPKDAIITVDAGNFSGWAQRFYQFRKFPSQLGPTSGAMGYSIPAAIAARLVHPDRPVVGFVGDGGSMMTGQELATAVHHGIDPVIIVVNNNSFGTIRMHQERNYPDRTHATDLTNPEFAIWAKSFGAYGELVTRTEDFPAAFERASNAGRAAVLELRLPIEAITARTTLSALRENVAR